MLTKNQSQLIPDVVNKEDECVLEFSKGNALRFTVSPRENEMPDIGELLQHLMRGGTPGQRRPQLSVVDADVLPFDGGPTVH